MLKTRSSSGASAAASYRRDASGRDFGDAFGGHDGTWIAVASLLQHAAAVGGVDAIPLLREAASLAEPLVGRTWGSKVSGNESDVGGVSHGADVIERLVLQLEDAGAIHLGDSMLESLAAADRTLSTLALGRIDARRARLAWKVGDIERAQSIYDRLAKIGARCGETELQARATLGYATLAQLRGDMSAMKRWSRSTARVAARFGHTELARFAYGGLFVVAAQERRFDDALVYGWKTYELAGDEKMALAEVLTNLGQLLLDAGHSGPSRAAFGAVLASAQPIRIGLPALGGFALASAGLGDTNAVRWAVDEFERETSRTHQAFPLADAAAECAIALATVGDVARSERCGSVVIRLANELGDKMNVYLEKLEVGVRHAAPRAPEKLTRRGRQVVRSVAALEPSELPTHVHFLVAA